MTTPTSRLFPSRRAQLLDWLQRSDPWYALSLLIVVVVLVGVWSARPTAPTVLGAIEPGRRYELLARSGAAWVQLAIDGSGMVWVRRDELEGVVDVATPLPTAEPIFIANEQQRATPTALAATVAPPTPTGTPPAPVPMVPRTIVYLNADGSVFAAYICQPYGDWRDTDPLYVHPECSE